MLEILHNSYTLIEYTAKVYYLKKDPETTKTYYETIRYLGENVGKFDLTDGSGIEWFMLEDDYVKESASTVSYKLSESGRKIDGMAD